MPKYAKKILLNISQSDLDRMKTMCAKHGLSQSEYIRQAIRMRVAEHVIQDLKSGRALHQDHQNARAYHGLRS